MPIKIGPKEKATDLQVYAIYGCKFVGSLQYGANSFHRLGLRGDLSMVLSCHGDYTPLESAIIGYPKDPEGGYKYDATFEEFEVDIKTWPEYGSAHVIIDVTSAEPADAKAIMNRLCDQLVAFYGGTHWRLVSAIPAHFIDPEVRNAEPEAKVGC